MAFDVGGGDDEVRPEINVTPLVDVVLVLLIIFMVITPLLTKRVSVILPAIKDSTNTPQTADSKPELPIVVTINKDGQIRLLDKLVPIGQLNESVSAMLEGRKDPVIFFDSDDSVPYGQALSVLDHLRDSSYEFKVAILTEPVAGKNR